MVTDRSYDIAQLRNHFHQLFALDRMRLHDRVFCRGQATGLAEDWGKNLVDLPNIMKKGCDRHALDLLFPEPNCLSNESRISRDSSRMPRCIRIPRFDSSHHKFKQLLVGLL